MYNDAEVTTIQRSAVTTHTLLAVSPQTPSISRCQVGVTVWGTISSYVFVALFKGTLQLRHMAVNMLPKSVSIG